MSATSQVCSLNYDYLVGLDPETMAPKRGQSSSGLATDWSASADGKTWVFTMRRNATWQDTHQPVTADDVAFTYNLIIKSKPATLVGYVSGIRRVKALDEFTVEIDCARPQAGLLYSASNLYILPKHVWSEVSSQSVALDYPNKPPVVGSGPFQTVAFKRGKYVELVANDNYWRGAPKIDRILFEMNTNEWLLAQELRTGALDGAQGLMNAQIRGLKESKTVSTQAYPVNGYSNLVFNSYVPPALGTSLGNPVLRDWRFRQALQWAVDREKLCDLALNGDGRPGDTVIAPGFTKDPDWHWTPPTGLAYRFDLQKARDLLDAAGYVDSSGDGIREFKGKPIRLRLVGRVESGFSLTASKLIAGWFKDVGLKIELQSLQSDALADLIYNTVDGKPAPDYDMFLWGWVNTLDPSSGLQYFTSDQIGGLSDTGFSDSEYDSLYRLQERTIDVTQRKSIVDRMQQIIYQESPQIVLAYTDDLEAWNTADWTGWQQVPPGSGSVMSTDSFLTVQPKSALADPAGTARGLVWLAVGVAVVGLVASALLIRRHRRRRRMPEEEPGG